MAAVRKALAAWFVDHGRDYPWRRTTDPYAILVSEVMLQQTRIGAVLGKGYYGRFLTEFPDPNTLAAADDTRLLKAWEGLGYYRRARMLRETARAVVERHGGGFPCGWDELLELPGVGRYTAGAVRAFAFGLPGAVVDGNVARVLARLMDFREPVDTPAGRSHMQAWAEVLERGGDPRIHNAALMELGQTHCRPRAPDCGACPVARYCQAGDPAALPVKRQRVPATAVDEHAVWRRDRRGRLLLTRESGTRRTGLWQLPLRAAAELDGLPLLADTAYTITRYRVRLRVYQGCGGRRGCGEEWFAPDELAALPMAAPFRRVVESLLESRRKA
jgi:A/G-specific adenine glycosylase